MVLGFMTLRAWGEPPWIRPGEQWLDDRGQPVQAHGGGMLKLGDMYYWFGEDRSRDNDPDKRYVSCYASKDLARWQFRNQVLTLTNVENLQRSWALERPKVYYNSRTKKFVMYFHLDGALPGGNAGYTLARVGVAMCDTVDGRYAYLKSFRPLGNESRDIGQFIDDDGTACLISEDRPKGFHIYKLSDDYLSIEKDLCLVPEHLEGGAIVRYDGLYYFVGSQLTSWDANPNKYATAKSLAGPWSEFKDIAPPETKTYGSQSTMLFKVAGTNATTMIFMADMWKRSALWDSRYLWMPLQIGGGRLWLPKPQPWRLDIATGNVTFSGPDNGAEAISPPPDHSFTTRDIPGTQAGTGRTAVWQWSVEVKSEKPQNGPARAWLWIPPGCKQVRGVVVAQHNMEEISILENPRFREALAEMDFAEVWVAPFFDHLFRFNEGAGDTFNDFMNRLADESGYSELKLVPVAPLGHSAAASWPYYFAAWNPQRTLCALSVSGQWPYFRDKYFAPDIWGDRNIDFVPCLESMGEYEAADSWSREGLWERQQHPLMPLSMLANPGQGHFAATDAKVEYLALYLKKAVEYRLPKNWGGNSTPQLVPIDPTKTGWLVDKWRRDQPPAAPAAPVGEYQGDPTQAFWYFDKQLALATEKYEAAARGLKPQLAGYVQDGKMVPQHDDHLQVNLEFKPGADGITFKLAGAFYDAVPPGSSRLPGWTQLPTNSPLGHATGPGISIDPICGPVEKLNADTFAVSFQKETLLNTNARSYELVFAATGPGDAEYKPAVQQAHMFIPARNTQGKEQHITFPEIPGQRAGTKSLKLNATSDANVPVHYFVREGPAEINGEELVFTKIPPRSKFPVKVTVVAWQYGSSAEPKLKTAGPVERTFDIIQ
jgi:hypothetical protein